MNLNKDWHLEWGSQKPPTELDEAYQERNAESKAMDDINEAIMLAQEKLELATKPINNYYENFISSNRVSE